MVYITGFLLGFGMIMSIGMQNLFVIRQGIRQEYPYWVALFCVLSDALLVILSFTSIAKLIVHIPIVKTLLSIAAIVFLLFLGLSTLYRTFQGKNGNTLKQLNQSDTKKTWLTISIAALGFSLLNPQAIFEMIVMMGGLADQYPSDQKLWFVLGILTSSFLWFFGLSYTASRLGDYFQSPKLWRVLDALSATLLLGLAGYFIALQFITH